MEKAMTITNYPLLLKIYFCVFVASGLLLFSLMLLYARTDNPKLYRPMDYIMRFLFLPVGIITILGEIVLEITDYIFKTA
jgi:hypothetical protein